MVHSLKLFRKNFFKYWDQFYFYLLKAIYYGAVPSIVLYGNYKANINHKELSIDY